MADVYVRVTISGVEIKKYDFRKWSDLSFFGQTKYRDLLYDIIFLNILKAQNIKRTKFGVNYYLPNITIDELVKIKYRLMKMCSAVGLLVKVRF
jgi:hypothetical protein